MRWVRRNGLVLATGLAASLPIIVSTIRAVAEGWLPLGDRAVIGVRAFDVLSTHPPLVGQYSAASQVIGKPVLSPGPLLYWLLALPVRLGGLAPAIAVGLVNSAAVVGVIALARRRGGPVLMVVTAGATALMCASLDAWIFHDIWNPSAALMPFLLLVFLAWSLACGEWRLLPLTALVASFVVQAQLTYALSSALVLAVGVGFLVASGPSVPRRWLLATLVVAALCWALPLMDEVVHRPGNVERILEAGTSGAPTLGAAAGWHSIVHAVGVPPWWLQGPRGTFARVAEVAYAPTTFAIATAVLMLGALVAVAAVGLRRGRRDLAAAALIALGLMLALGLVTAGTPSGGILFGVVGYTLWWASPAGMFCWLVIGYGTVALFGRRVRGDLPLPAAAAPAALACVAAIGAVVAGAGGPDRFQPAFDQIHRIVDRSAAAAAPGADGLVLGGALTEVATEVRGAIAYRLRGEGVRVLSASPPGIGTRYDPALHPHSREIDVTEGPGQGRGRLVAREVLPGVPSAQPGGARGPRAVTVSVAP